MQSLTYQDIEPLASLCFERLYGEKTPPIGTSCVVAPHRLAWFALCRIAERPDLSANEAWDQSTREFLKEVQGAMEWPAAVPLTLEAASGEFREAVIDYAAALLELRAEKALPPA